MKKKTVALLVCMFCVAVVPWLWSQGKSDDVVATITRLENESAKASAANDVSFTKKYAVDDYTEGTSFGEWITKAQSLKDAEDRTKTKTNSFHMSELKVASYGNAAVARYKIAYDDLFRGQHRSRTVICTDSWAKQGADWKLTSTHCSQAK